MALNYNHVSRASGSTLTATIYNADHTNHITNGDLVNDLTPQLGGDLDLNGKNIDFPSTLNISDCLDEDDMSSDSATALATQQSIKKYVDDNAGAGKNLLINGDFSVKWQRGESFTSATTPANSDDTYLADRWVLLSDGNDVVDVTKQTSGGVSGSEDYIRLDVETVQKKFGILQIIEGVNAQPILGTSQVASLSFEAKVTDATKLSDIRAVVLTWDGTKDTVTSDIVSAWNAEGTRPTYVANWTAENVDTDLNVTTSWVKYTIENISIDTASGANVGVFIYQNNVAANDTAGIFLEITKVQLELGSSAGDYEVRNVATELAMCQRYFWASGGTNNENIGSGFNISATAGRIVIKYPVPMRTVPSFSADATNMFNIDHRATSTVTSNVAADKIGTNHISLDLTVASGLTTGDGIILRHINTSNYIRLNAEL